MTVEYKVSSVWPWQTARAGYDVYLVDPDAEKDEYDEEKSVGGFSFEGDGLPPELGEMVKIEGKLGTPECIIEWKHGRMNGLKYENKEEARES